MSSTTYSVRRRIRQPILSLASSISRPNIAQAKTDVSGSRCRFRQELLPAGYFHLVFSVPHALVPLIWQNKRHLFGLLFHASAATLLEVAADPARLGAEIGFLSILHTWGQTLQRHPHVHCVVPGGGRSPDHSRWIRAAPHFFLPVRVLSRVFRGKFVAGLRRAFQSNQLVFLGPCQSLANEKAFAAFLRTLFQEDWVVYAKAPFGGPEHVLQYLARYTHRVAISNHRLLSVDGSVGCIRRVFPCVLETLPLPSGCRLGGRIAGDFVNKPQYFAGIVENRSGGLHRCVNVFQIRNRRGRQTCFSSRNLAQHPEK